jgi:hypothetical protein
MTREYSQLVGLGANTLLGGNRKIGVRNAHCRVERKTERYVSER